MKIDNVEEWAKAHAGRKVRWKGGDGEAESTVVGYRLIPNPTSLRKSCIVVHGRIKPSVSAYTGNNFAGFGVSVVDVSKCDPYRYAWITPDQIINLVGNAVDNFLSNVFAQPKLTFKKKEIAPYPHVCPKCKGPAYIGFNTTVDCESKCGFKTQ